MAKSFTITTSATETLKADAKGHAEATFTVVNATPRPVRGMARAKPLGDTKREWLSIGGETERDFGGGTTEQFTVKFDAPGAPGGKYPFRLDVASALNPDEDFTEGPIVNVEIPAAATVPEPPKKKFPVWIILVIAGVLLIVIIVVIILVARSGGRGNNNAEASGTPIENTPMPTFTPKPTEPEVANACVEGYVWREANASDKVCVTPEVRYMTQKENLLADKRRNPNGGPYGPNTCLEGYVWREAYSGDVVCVPPDSREQARQDNAEQDKRVKARNQR